MYACFMFNLVHRLEGTFLSLCPSTSSVGIWYQVCKVGIFMSAITAASCSRQCSWLVSSHVLVPAPGSEEKFVLP
jgi:hypothetical protein